MMGNDYKDKEVKTLKRLIDWIKVVGLMAVMVGIVSHAAPGLNVAAGHAVAHHKVTTMYAPTYPLED